MAKKDYTLTAERLRALIHYNEDTGKFTNLKQRGPSKAGSSAGATRKDNGYVTIGIDGTNYYAHRLAFLWMTGRWPEGDHVDHINGDPSDNRFSNLRDESVSVNLHNQRGSKVKGYYWSKNHKKYRAQIVVKGKAIVIGAFDHEEEARAAYIEYKTNLGLNTERFMTK